MWLGEWRTGERIWQLMNFMFLLQEYTYLADQRRSQKFVSDLARAAGNKIGKKGELGLLYESYQNHIDEGAAEYAH